MSGEDEFKNIGLTAGPDVVRRPNQKDAPFFRVAHYGKLTGVPIKSPLPTSTYQKLQERQAVALINSRNGALDGFGVAGTEEAWLPSTKLLGVKANLA
jgi:hypothetical protein